MEEIIAKLVSAATRFLVNIWFDEETDELVVSFHEGPAFRIKIASIHQTRE